MQGLLDNRSQKKRWLALMVLCLALLPGMLLLGLGSRIASNPLLLAAMSDAAPSDGYRLAFMAGAVFAAMAALVGAALLRVGLHTNAAHSDGIQGSAA